MRQLLSSLINRPTKPFPNDDFIKRIRSLVIGHGMLQESNIYLMDYAISRLHDHGAVLEIGSYGGLSTNVIIHLLKKHGKANPVFSCDAWIYEGFNDAIEPGNITIDGRNDIQRATYSEYMKQAFVNGVKFLSADNLPHSFHSFSNDFLIDWKNGINKTDLFDRQIKLGGPIAFAYIDGGHSFEQAYGDFLKVADFIQPGGFMLLDDSADYYSFGSAKMMKEVKNDQRFEIVDGKNNYLLKRI